MRLKIDWASLKVGSKFAIFALFYFVFEGKFQVQVPGGAYIWRGLFSKFYGIYNDNLVCNTNLQRVLKKKNEYKDKMNVTSVRFES